MGSEKEIGIVIGKLEMLISSHNSMKSEYSDRFDRMETKIDDIGRTQAKTKQKVASLALAVSLIMTMAVEWVKSKIT